MQKFKLRVPVLIGAVVLFVFAIGFGIKWFTSKADDDVVAVDVQTDRLKPAGKLILDAATDQPAVAPLTMNFVRTPDKTGPDGRGRFLIAVNSGYGLMFNSRSRAQQTLSVIDLNLKPEPKVVQNVYFPGPQSANFGLAFDERAKEDGTYRLYLAGGFENKIWTLNFDPKAAQPLIPKNAPDEKFDAPFIDVSGFAENAP